MQVTVLAQDPYFARVRVTLPDGQDLMVVVNYLPTLVDGQYRLFVDGTVGERTVVRTDVTVAGPPVLAESMAAESMAAYRARLLPDCTCGEAYGRRNRQTTRLCSYCLGTP